MQRIFSSASRRETLGRHSKGGRRGGGLKIDWTKPPPRAWPMGIDCRLDLGRGAEGVRGGQRTASPVVATMFTTYLFLASAKKVLSRVGPKGIDAATRMIGFFRLCNGHGTDL